MTEADVRSLPPVADVPTATAVLGIGRTAAYELILYGRWPYARAPARQADPGPIRPRWFSDGGICSNLPVHFFDQSLPTVPRSLLTWPTFLAAARSAHLNRTTATCPRSTREDYCRAGHIGSRAGLACSPGSAGP
jgi:hypothetical protein